MVAENIHAKNLLPSTLDDVMLVIMLDVKYRELEALHRRVRDVDLVIPMSLHRDVLACKRVLRRYRCQLCRRAALATNEDGSPALDRQDGLPYCAHCGGMGRGDYRHSAAERISIRTIAQWTVDLKRQLANQPPLVIEWPED